ncbi:MAG: TonB-dependent receptor, partial [Novosphingobium sp.]
KGVDLLLDATLADGLKITANYTWSQLRNPGSSLQRDRAPKQYAKGWISYEPETLPFSTNLSVDWVGDAYTTLPGFGRLNYGNYALVNLGFHLYPDSERKHRFGINVENLFNKDYASIGYGRSVTDAGRLDGTNTRFLYYTRGTPRMLRVSYGINF